MTRQFRRFVGIRFQEFIGLHRLLETSINRRWGFVKQIRTRLTYANVMSSVAVFLVLGGATAIAAIHIGKKSVGAPQLKSNAVTTAKIKKNAVTKKKIKNGAVDGSKVKDNSLTGADIDESSLGTIPSAANVNDLVGMTRFNFRVPFGGSTTFLTAGPFSLTATCQQNTSDFEEPTNNNLDIARILISTNTNGMVFDAEESKRGAEPTDFLDITTPEKERVVDEETAPTGKTTYQAASSEDSAAYQPNGIGVSLDQDGLGVGVNVGGPGCIFHGFAIVENPS